MTDDDPDSSSDDGPQPDARLLASALGRLPQGLLDRPPRLQEPAGGSPCRLEIQNPCRYREVQARRLRPWIAGIARELAPDAETFTVRMTSDREMRRLSSSFRQIDKTTDVLSFPGDLESPWGLDAEAAFGEGALQQDAPALHDDSFPGEPKHLGDVVISVPTARRQAAELGRDVGEEVRVLTLHGLLHCLGFDHEQDDGEMEALESVLRRRYLAPGARR